MKTLYIKDIKSEFRTFSDKSDPWGACMGILFDICAELHHRAPNIGILKALGYSPGAGGDGREPDSYWYELLLDVHTGDLVALAMFFDRYRAKLVIAGEDY